MEIKVYLLVIISISNIIQTKSDNIKDSFNILMKDSAIYTVDEYLTPDDYEMMENNEGNEKSVNQMLPELNKLAEEEYRKTYTNAVNNEEIFQQINIYDVTAIIHNETKRVHKRDTFSGEELNYDYDKLINDYIDYDNGSEFMDDRVESTVNGFNDFISIINDTIRQPKTIFTRIGNNLTMWFLLYLGITIPFWCTKVSIVVWLWLKGWSCCCLFCKLFKPERTINEAKRYFAANPPGVITLPNVGVIHYEASESEKESYEKFGHIIRTI